MKNTYKILIGITAIAFAGLIIYKKRRSKCSGYMLNRVADEGYETAHDVLFPQKDQRGKKLRYGPVLPE